MIRTEFRCIQAVLFISGVDFFRFRSVLYRPVVGPSVGCLDLGFCLREVGFSFRIPAGNCNYNHVIKT